MLYIYITSIHVGNVTRECAMVFFPLFLFRRYFRSDNTVCGHNKCIVLINVSKPTERKQLNPIEWYATKRKCADTKIEERNI